MTVLMFPPRLRAAGGYKFDGSGLVSAGANYLTRANTTGGDSKTFIVEAIVQLAETGTEFYLFGADNGNPYFRVDWNNNPFDSIQIIQFQGSVSPYAMRLYTDEAIFKDQNAFYHFIIAFDTTQATASDRVRLWVNGTSVNLSTSHPSGGGNWPAQNLDILWNGTTYDNQLFSAGSSSANNAPHYYSRFAGYDGQTMTDPETDGFGETVDNAWQINDVSGKTFGTNGFLIEGQNVATGTDTSGNSNSFSKTGTITAVNQAPTDDGSDVGNFAVLNALEPTWNAAVTLSEGNTKFDGSSATLWNNKGANIALTSGKWIVAVSNDVIAGGGSDIWVANETGYKAQPSRPDSASNFWVGSIDATTTFKDFDEGTSTSHTMAASAVAGDYTLMALDVDNLKVWFGWHDVSTGTTYWADGSTGFTGDPAAGTNETHSLSGSTFYFGIQTYTGRGGKLDCGQGDLLDNITIPSGFKRIGTQNLPDGGTITSGTNDANDFVYTGGVCETVTWGGTTYDIDTHDNSVIEFYSNGFIPLSGGTSVSWTATIRLALSVAGVNQVRGQING